MNAAEQSSDYITDVTDLSTSVRFYFRLSALPLSALLLTAEKQCARTHDSSGSLLESTVSRGP